MEKRQSIKKEFNSKGASIFKKMLEDKKLFKNIYKKAANYLT
jgi:hypothetical protein